MQCSNMQILTYDVFSFVIGKFKSFLLFPFNCTQVFHPFLLKNTERLWKYYFVIAFSLALPLSEQTVLGTSKKV